MSKIQNPEKSIPTVKHNPHFVPRYRTFSFNLVLKLADIVGPPDLQIVRPPRRQQVDSHVHRIHVCDLGDVLRGRMGRDAAEGRVGVMNFSFYVRSE